MTGLQRGFTLVELMVSMVIGLTVTLAVTQLVTFGESQKRATVSQSDVSQGGAYASYLLDRAVRSAGSGFVQSWDLGAVGCRLTATRGGTAILPRTGGFPGAFANLLGGVSQDLRLAPVLIGKGQASSGSDVLVVMGGNGASGDVSRSIRTPGSLPANELRLDNNIGVAQNDIVLMSQAGTDACLVQQLGAPTGVPDSIAIAGDYVHGADPYSTLRTTGAAFLTPLGNRLANNVQFQAFAVGDNQTLFSYDFLRMLGDGSDAAATQAIADGVVALRAIYGIDTNADGIFDQWMDPGAAGYDIASMVANPARVREVIAIRLALVLRGTHYEREGVDAGGNPTYVAPSSLVLFPDLPASMQSTVTLNTDQRHYRHRIVDTVIPLRNVLLLPTT